MPHANCESLWQDLLHAQLASPRVSPQAGPETPAAVRSYRIPEEFLSSVHPAVALKLEPADAEALAIHLTARSQFAVGRSAGMADFIARVLPENEANNARTNRLSRVHALLEIDDGHITLRDGNGNGPSLNGSQLDGQALTPHHPTVLPHRGRLVLAGEYALDLVPLARPEPLTATIANIEAWPGPAESAPLAPYGALVCEPVEGHALSRHNVWLFSEAGFGLDAAGSIIWDTRGRGVSPATFHYYRGCFWLRNEALAEPVLAGADTVLGRGEIIPLAPGQIIHLGGRAFTVHLE
jgi:hypothetical protein